MSSRPFIFLCPGCKRTHRNEPNEIVCVYCSGEFQKMMLLYTRIVARYPSLRRVPISEVFKRMYEKAIQ